MTTAGSQPITVMNSKPITTGVAANTASPSPSVFHGSPRMVATAVPMKRGNTMNKAPPVTIRLRRARMPIPAAAATIGLVGGSMGS